MLLPAYQEHYGGVHVEVFEVEAEQAHALSKGPRVADVIINPEGQRENVGQVCQRQVYHEDHCLGLLTVEHHAEELAMQRTCCGLLCVCMCT